METAAVVLAAGKGTRMKSEKPKVLHEICGRPMINHVVDAVKKAGAGKVVVVVGYGGEEVEKVLDENVITIYQHEQLGTAHALLQAQGVLEGACGRILVVCGDTPLLKHSTLDNLMSKAQKSKSAASVLTAELDDPAGYGRVVRDDNGDIYKIVEQKDCSVEELSIREVNTGIYCFSAEGLFESLSKLDANNEQAEYYLTDIVELYRNSGRQVNAVNYAEAAEILGVNDRRQLAHVEKVMQGEILDNLMLSGVTVKDPDNTYVGSMVTAGTDTVIYPFTIIEGETVIGDRCCLGPYTRLKDAVIGSDVTVENSTVTGSRIGDSSSIGPYAYIRPGCVIGNRVKIGDFVEMKKTEVGDDSKVPHLSYVGDSRIGKNVNVGAGTITCNYDGRDKHFTYIDDGAFIGSNTSLVAPVNVGKNALVGAGSTITKDVPAGALGVARGRQKVYDRRNPRSGEEKNEEKK